MIKKIIKGGNFDPQMIGELEFDQVPEEGSFNPVTSDAVVKAIDEAKEDMQEKIDEVTLDPSAVALGNVHLLDEVTELPADGCILIDSETNGPGEMSKDTLLELTAQNALADVRRFIAPVFAGGNFETGIHQLFFKTDVNIDDCEVEVSVYKNHISQSGKYLYGVNIALIRAGEAPVIFECFERCDSIVTTPVSCYENSNIFVLFDLSSLEDGDVFRHLVFNKDVVFDSNYAPTYQIRSLSSEVGKGFYRFQAFQDKTLNAVIKELFFENEGCSGSVASISVFKNYYQSSLNRYLNGLQIIVGTDPTINLLSQSVSPTYGVHYIENASCRAIIDLSVVSDGITSFSNVAIKKELVNDLIFWPGIAEKEFENDVSPKLSSLDERVERIEDCFEDYVNPANVYDNEHPNILDLYIDTSVFRSSATTKTLYFKCKKNQTYTISVKNGYYARFSAAESADVPAKNIPCTLFFNWGEAPTTQNGRDYWQVETSNDAKYLAIYYSHSSYDTKTEAEIRATIMVTEGAVMLDYTPYESRTLLKEKALPFSVESLVDEDPFSSRSRVYGIEFDVNSQTSLCARIGDAVGKRFNYAVGADMVYDWTNDFDSIYPWCDIRRCNVSGGVVVAYEGDDDFAVDGTNGDVFVEIPKFYSYRKVVDGKEQIAISGTKHAGFVLEPAFVDSLGNELDFIYVAAYDVDSSDNSASGLLPKTLTSFNRFVEISAGKGYTVYDLAVLNAIQKLVVIENADKNVSQFYEGYGHVPYYQSCYAVDTLTSVNTFEVAGNSQVMYFRVGMAVSISDQSSAPSRTITAITGQGFDSTDNKYHATVTLDGEPFDVVADSTMLFGMQQKNGGCDATMTYHTGRAGENGVTACRYRWMENLWGNVWMQTAGIVVKDLEYYFTTNPSKYQSALTEFEKVLAFDAPEQNHYPGTIYGWIKSCGYDRKNSALILPQVIASSSPQYYSAKVYTYGLTDYEGRPVAAGTELSCVSGGGWDHLNRNSPFSMRFWDFRSEGGGGYSHLYGNRFVIRESI